MSDTNNAPAPVVSGKILGGKLVPWQTNRRTSYRPYKSRVSGTHPSHLPMLPELRPAQLRKWRRLKQAYEPGVDWSQIATAARLGIDQRTWRRWEQGHRRIHGLFVVLMRVLGEQGDPATLLAFPQLFPMPAAPAAAAEQDIADDDDEPDD